MASMAFTWVEFIYLNICHAHHFAWLAITSEEVRLCCSLGHVLKFKLLNMTEGDFLDSRKICCQARWRPEQLFTPAEGSFLSLPRSPPYSAPTTAVPSPHTYKYSGPPCQRLTLPKVILQGRGEKLVFSRNCVWPIEYPY